MRIVNILADGSVLEDLTGVLIKPDSAKDFYELLARINTEQ